MVRMLRALPFAVRLGELPQNFTRRTGSQQDVLWCVSVGLFHD